MRIGFLTNVLADNGMKDLMEIAKWGSQSGFQDMEVGPTVELKEETIAKIREEKIIDISALIYCRNFLIDDPETASAHRENILKRIDMAGKYKIAKVICSTGVSREAFDEVCFEPEKSLDKSVEFLNVMVEEAEKNNVTLCIENCPLMGNIGFAPFMWEKIFDKVDSPRLKLAFDPSHFIWQFMDPYQAILEFGDKIAHVHAKDTEILTEILKRRGILYKPRPIKNQFRGWWRYRVPGLGEIDWNKLIDCLYQTGYDDTISIEHEDSVWEGNLDKVKAGMLRGRRHLEQFL